MINKDLKLRGYQNTHHWSPRRREDREMSEKNTRKISRQKLPKSDEQYNVRNKEAQKVPSKIH